jgi:hypothetical protein
MVLVAWAGRPQCPHPPDKARRGRRFPKKRGTHLSWLTIGLRPCLVHFRDAPTLAAEPAGTAPVIAYLFLGIFTLTTHAGRHAREQVHLHVPWPRIQGAMVDHDAARELQGIA